MAEIQYPELPRFTLLPGAPDFCDLPWDHPLSQWGECGAPLESAPIGVSRHPVQFVSYRGGLFAFKEMPIVLVQKEYTLLQKIQTLHLPVVQVVGMVETNTSKGRAGILITRYLEGSLPYRMLFMSPAFKRYRRHLLDAIVGLLVQLHLAGVYWGDLSLSNTLFRRDAGALRAYMVDAETTEIYPQDFPAMLRFHDLEIMEENVNGDLYDLIALGAISEEDFDVPSIETGRYIRLRYQQLWEEITREDILTEDEHYRIQERVRALNSLGFSVGNVELAKTDAGNQLRLRVMVTDRNFHRDQLTNLTGLDAEENQAQKMVNEILELQATLSSQHNRSISLSVAAYHWLENVYRPAVQQLEPLIDAQNQPAELYCQVLEHKWYLSERAQRDVGHSSAVTDYLSHFGQQNLSGNN
jgi:hypothetical protein